MVKKKRTRSITIGVNSTARLQYTGVLSYERTSYDPVDALDLAQPDFAPRSPVKHYVVSDKFVSKYRSDFKVSLPEKYLTDGTMFNEMMFDMAVCGFFNRDLARAMALADWGVTYLEDWFEQQYLLEDAITRICSCWDYLFQHLSYFVDVNEGPTATRGAREQLLGMQAYEHEWIRGADGISSVRSTPKPLQDALESMRAVQNHYQFQYLTTRDGAKKLFQHLRDTYVETAWIDEIKKLFRDESTRKIFKLRNDILHVHSLGTVFALTDSDYSGVPRTGWQKKSVAPADTWKLAKTAHKRLETAIPFLRRAMIIQDSPNTKEQGSHPFHVHTLICRKCDKAASLPCPLPDIKDMHFCRNCASWLTADEAEMPDSIPCSPHVFAGLWSHHLERMKAHLGSHPLSQK